MVSAMVLLANFSLETLPMKTKHLAPAFLHSICTSFSSSLLGATRLRLAKLMANARPIPFDAPVKMTVFP